jgi:hypothetical protein
MESGSQVAGGGRKEGSTAEQLRAAHGRGVRVGALGSTAQRGGIERPGARSAAVWKVTSVSKGLFISVTYDCRSSN